MSSLGGVINTKEYVACYRRAKRIKNYRKRQTAKKRCERTALRKEPALLRAIWRNSVRQGLIKPRRKKQNIIVVSNPHTGLRKKDIYEILDIVSYK